MWTVTISEWSPAWAKIFIKLQSCWPAVIVKTTATVSQFCYWETFKNTENCEISIWFVFISLLHVTDNECNLTNCWEAKVAEIWWFENRWKVSLDPRQILRIVLSTLVIFGHIFLFFGLSEFFFKYCFKKSGKRMKQKKKISCLENKLRNDVMF